MVRESEDPSGSEIRRHSIGLDLRFSGHEPGVSIGYRSVQGLCPKVLPFSSLPRLADAVEDYFRTPPPLEEAGPLRWHFFYFRDGMRLDQRTTRFESIEVGLQAVSAVNGGRFTVGGSNHRHYVGKGLNDHIVQLLRFDAENPRKRSLRLWEWRQEPSLEPW